MIDKDALARTRTFLKQAADNLQAAIDDDGSLDDHIDKEEFAHDGTLVWHAIECVEAYGRGGIL